SVAHRPGEVEVGDEADAGSGIGRQQPGGSVRRAAEGGPVAAAVGAELPVAVGVVDGDDGDALDGAEVAVGDAVAAGRGDDGADQVAGVRRRILVDGGQRHDPAVVEDRGVIDALNRDGGRLGGGAEGGAAAVDRHVRRAAVGPA